MIIPIVIIVLLLGVAFIFRERLGKLIGDIFDTAETEIGNINPDSTGS